MDKKPSQNEVWGMRTRVVAYLLKNGASSDDAEDIASETCIRAFTKWGLFDPEKGQLDAWVLRIAHNLYVSMLRKRRFEVCAVELEHRNKIRVRPEFE